MPFLSGQFARRPPPLVRLYLAIGLVLLALPVPGRAQLATGERDREPLTFAGLTDPLHAEFARQQLRHPRVMRARVDARYGIKKLYRDAGLPYPAAEVFIRVFKRERVLELWARPRETNRFLLLKSYPICALAGVVGPKRRQGDEQTPEGFYEIDSFNPASQYLLSLHVNYPNESDRVLSNRQAPGGLIYIHGGCKTRGCIAVEDEAIKELYWIAVEARSGGQQKIPVHIFPSRLTSGELEQLGSTFDGQAELLAFWTNLQPGYEFFERTRTLPDMTVDGAGRYVLNGGGGSRRAQDEDAGNRR